MKCRIEMLMHKLHKHMRKYYHTYSLLANGMTAMAVAGLALLGVLNGVLTAAAMVLWGLLFAGIYAAGKWLDQEVEDIDKVAEHTHSCSTEHTKMLGGCCSKKETGDGCD